MFHAKVEPAFLRAQLLTLLPRTVSLCRSTGAFVRCQATKGRNGSCLQRFLYLSPTNKQIVWATRATSKGKMSKKGLSLHTVTELHYEKSSIRVEAVRDSFCPQGTRRSNQPLAKYSPRRTVQPKAYIITIRIHSSCEIDSFVETHLCKMCVILRSRVFLGACPH